MDLTEKEFENDNFNVEPEPYRYTKKTLLGYTKVFKLWWKENLKYS